MEIPCRHDDAFGFQDGRFQLDVQECRAVWIHHDVGHDAHLVPDHAKSEVITSGRDSLDEVAALRIRGRAHERAFDHDVYAEQRTLGCLVDDLAFDAAGRFFSRLDASA